MPRSKITGSEQANIPTIACINRATVDMGVDFAKLISALQKYVDKHLFPVWATPAKLVETIRPRNRAWTMIFLDTAEDARKLHLDPQKIFGKEAKDIAAFHHFKGLPVALVFVETVLAEKSRLMSCDKVSLAASHELAEMLVDPGNNLWCDVHKGKLYAFEVCDAVEKAHFPVDGLAMSDFVYPTFFQAFRKPRSTQFDHMKRVTRPFQILAGGYMPRRKAGKIILHASLQKRRALRAENRDLHRSEFRKRGLGIPAKQ
jgi:hypothetical protein